MSVYRAAFSITGASRVLIVELIPLEWRLSWSHDDLGLSPPCWMAGVEIGPLRIYVGRV